MEKIGSRIKYSFAMIAIISTSFALGACGPQVTSGDENAVFIKAGPFSNVTDVENSAQRYCQRFGKNADLEGGEPEPGTLQDTYHFDCVDMP